MGTVGSAYESVALLGFNLSESPDGTSDQCGYKPADGTKLGPPGVTVSGSGLAINFSKTVGSVCASRSRTRWAA